MKKIILFLSIIAVVCSCEGMLDEVPKSFVSRSNYFQNENDAEGAIVGAYSAIKTDYYGIAHTLMLVLHADYINGRGSQAGISYVNQVLDATNIARCETNWTTLYSAINKANMVINNVPNIEDIDPAVKAKILGEGYFLRAMAYFNLVQGWGAVPLRLTECTDVNSLAASRTSVDEIYNQIIKDAQGAVKGLKGITVGAATGRASEYAARMLLAETYLTTENWAACAAQCDTVIASGVYQLVIVEKESDFYNIFNAAGNSEDIFSVHNSETRKGWLAKYIHRANVHPYNYSSTGYYAWIPDTNSFIGSSWDDNDLRKQFNFYSEYLNSKGDTVSLPSSTPVLFKKYITDENGYSQYPFPVYRYAEAFLMYAEAATMANGAPTDLALERLNVIKRRAYAYDLDVASPVDYAAGMSASEFRKVVLQERAYEFLLEGKRWWDLKRTGTIDAAFAAVGKSYNEYRYLLPIPEDEINTNSALSSDDQNPGY